MKSDLSVFVICLGIAFAVGCSKSAPPKPAAESPAKSEDTKPADASGASLGSPGPAWENLAGTDDKTHSLKDLSEAKAIAVVFTCNHCPVAVDYEDRLVKLTDDDKDKNVAVVAINVKTSDNELLPAMKERAEAKKFNFAYVSDPSQAIGKAYGATVTPHVFLLDANRNVAYIGAIDDSRDESQVTTHSLRDALDAVLAGQTPAIAKTRQFGCGISYQ